MLSDPLLVILDIDETLVYSTHEPLEATHDFIAGPYMVYKRPGLDSFVKEAAAAFRLAVWSSSTRPYAEALAKVLFAGVGLEFLWARERCTQRLDPETQEYFWLKDLKKVRRRGFPLDRVVVVDDSPEKIARHYGNHIRVNPFLGDPADDELPRLTNFLAQLASCPNVREVEKRGWRLRVS